MYSRPCRILKVNECENNTTGLKSLRPAQELPLCLFLHRLHRIDRSLHFRNLRSVPVAKTLANASRKCKTTLPFKARTEILSGSWIAAMRTAAMRTAKPLRSNDGNGACNGAIGVTQSTSNETRLEWQTAMRFQQIFEMEP